LATVGNLPTGSLGDQAVGINLTGSNLNQILPTANFHTRGTVRMEQLPTGTGRILVIDDAGNIFRSNKSVKTESKEELALLKQELAILRTELNQLKNLLSNTSVNKTSSSMHKTKFTIGQNVPNTTTNETSIDYTITTEFNQAVIVINDANGNTIKQIPIVNKSGAVKINTAGLAQGIYTYAFVIDGIIENTKQLVVAR
jgi:hypothetical protein